MREFMQIDLELQIDSFAELMDTAKELLHCLCEDAVWELVPYLPLTTGNLAVIGENPSGASQSGLSALSWL